MFLRWIRVLFSSLRCFFFAIRLRRFLITEPIRPPSSSAQRQTGTPSRSPGTGGWAHARNSRDRVNAYRSRSPLAYLLPHSGVTAWCAIVAPGPLARTRAAAEARAGHPHADAKPRHAGAGRLATGTRLPDEPDEGRQNTCPRCCGGSGLPRAQRQRQRSAGAYERGPQVLIDRLFRHPERTTDPYGFQFARVHQPIHGHLRYPHDRCYFGDGKESHVA